MGKNPGTDPEESPRIKDLKREVPQLKLEGVLESIPHIGNRYENPRLSGVSSTLGFSGPEYDRKSYIVTLLNIKTSEGTEEVEFPGIVFPDSIGNKVQLYERREKPELHDLDLKRIYGPVYRFR